MASGRNGTLYLGVTSNLVQRCHQHREGMIDGFSKKYGCRQLVWFEVHDDLQEARLRELQIKKWKRAGKFVSFRRTILTGATSGLISRRSDGFLPSQEHKLERSGVRNGRPVRL